MHALIGTELSKARALELIDRARRERYLRRPRRPSTRRPAPAIRAD